MLMFSITILYFYEYRDTMTSYPTHLIGPSTGWLSAKLGPSLALHARILDDSNSTAAELMFGDRERIDAMCSQDLVTRSSKIKFLSLHLPGFGEDFSESSSRTRHDLLKIFSRHRIHGTALHPDLTPASAFEILKSMNIPIGIENMDRLKNDGKDAASILKLCERFQTKAVIDVQHAYENSVDANEKGPTVASELLHALKNPNRISHLHVSGEISSASGKQEHNHASLLDATNRDEILTTLKEIAANVDVLPPIILEGDPLPEFPVGFYMTASAAQIRKAAGYAAERITKERELILEALRS